jgi:opacity protein-like surface antigen
MSMKPILSLGAILLLSATLIGPALGDDGGFYLAAKIGMSSQKYDRTALINQTLTDNNGTSISPRSIPIGGRSQSSVVGGLTIGYDFQPSFNVPVRFDIDFMARSYKDIDQRHVVRVTAVDGGGNSISEDVAIRESGEIGVHTIMANLYYDIHLDSPFTPYLGASFGLAALHMDLKNSEIEGYYGPADMHAGDIQFAWGLGAGVSYAFNKDWSLDMGYKYINGGENSLTSDITFVGMEADIQIHDVLLGARYTF